VGAAVNTTALTSPTMGTADSPDKDAGKSLSDDLAAFAGTVEAANRTTAAMA
jgi:hypothetical protein